MSILPHLCVAAGICLIGGLAVWQSAVIPKGAMYAAVGAHVFPWFVTGFLLVMGVGLIVAALRGGWAHDQDGTITEWGSLALVGLGLFANLMFIDGGTFPPSIPIPTSWQPLTVSWFEFPVVIKTKGLGFILSTTIMFPLVARAFGSKQWLRDSAIGFALAFISYVGFDRVLGYKIGTGLIENLI